MIKRISLNRETAAGIVFATAATVIWSLNYIIARGLHDQIPPASLAFYRWLTASIVLIPIAIKPVFRELEAVKSNLKYIVLTSLPGITVFNTLIYLAGRTTEAINLSLMAITSPIFIVIFSIFMFDEKAGIKKVFGIIITVSGIILLLTKGNIDILLNISFTSGDIWMLIAAMTFAFYSIMVKKKPAELSGITFLFSTFFAGLLMLAPFYIAELVYEPYPRFSSEIIFSVLYLGIFASVTAFFLWNRAIEKIGASNSGLIYYTLPLFSTLLAIIFLDEIAGIVHLISMICILTGIIIAGDNDKKLTKNVDRK